MLRIFFSASVVASMFALAACSRQTMPAAVPQPAAMSTSATDHVAESAPPTDFEMTFAPVDATPAPASTAAGAAPMGSFQPHKIVHSQSLR